MSGGRQAGSTTIAVLVLLTLLAAAAGGGALVLGGALARERKSDESYALRHGLELEGERVAALFAADPTPGADSPQDPIWEALAQPEAAFTDSLRDVSSALNPNWVQKNVFLKTGLKTLLKDAGSLDVLQQRRADEGFSTDLVAAYGDLFNEGALQKYFTAYGYPNINVTDEFALRKLFAIRTGDDAAADIFHSRIQGVLIAQRVLKRDELRAFLGLDYDALYPVMNVEPCMNAHFVDSRTLTELLACPDLKVPHPQEAAQAILDTREKVEITDEQLHRIIGAPEDSRIYQYLGVTTWFWSITVRSSAGTLVMIVARMPGAPEAKRRFTVVEKRYSRT